MGIVRYKGENMVLLGWEIILGGVSVIVGILALVYTIWRDRKKKKIKSSPTKPHRQEQKGENKRPSKSKPSKETKEKPTKITLLDERISIPKNCNVKTQFDLKRGDRIKGKAEEMSGRTFSIYVIDEENYHEFQNGEDYHCEKEYEDIVQTHIFVEIPYDDTWYIVFDTSFKQVDRRVKVKLQKK